MPSALGSASGFNLAGLSRKISSCFCVGLKLLDQSHCYAEWKTRQRRSNNVSYEFDLDVSARGLYLQGVLVFKIDF